MTAGTDGASGQASAAFAATGPTGPAGVSSTGADEHADSAITAASQPKPEPLADAQWKQVASRFQSLEVPLPMASEWQVLDGKHELRAIHRPTDSELSARLWRASRLVSRDECEKQLHLWRPDLPNPSEAPETVLDSRDITAPAGFSVTVTAGVRRTDTSL